MYSFQTNGAYTEETQTAHNKSCQLGHANSHMEVVMWISAHCCSSQSCTDVSILMQTERLYETHKSNEDQ